MNTENNGETQPGTVQEPSKSMGLQQSLTNAQQKVNNSQYGKILKVVAIEDTPFTIVTVETEEGNYADSFISIGTHRITPMMYESEAKVRIKKKDWGLIVSLVTIITERVYEQIKLEDKARNKG